MKKILLFAFLVVILSASFAYADTPGYTLFQLSLLPQASLPPMYDNVYGLRINLLWGSNRSVRGLDVGLAGDCQDNMSGLQISALGSYNRISEGLQISGLANLSGELKGVQISGICNYSEKLVPFSLQASMCNLTGVSDGIQCGLLNIAQDIGAQVGIYNITNISGGFQIGLINTTGDELEGYQIGLINISKGRFVPFINLVPYIAPF